MIAKKKVTASIFGISLAGLDDWVRRGCPQLRGGRKGIECQFDTAQVAAWREQQAILAQSGSGDPDLKDLDAVRARKIRVDTEIAEIELAKVRRDAISLDVAVKAWCALVAAFRSRMLSVPAKLAPILVAETDLIATRNTLETEIHAALDELSHYNPDTDLSDIERGLERDTDGPADSSENSDAPAEADGEPVGGQVPETQPGDGSGVE